jgi:hypothetical protein
MASQWRNFLIFAFAAAVGTPTLAQAAGGSESAESIPDLSGVWAHALPGFEPLASGPTALVNRSRRPNGTGDALKLTGDYTNPILKPAAAEIVKKHGELGLNGIGDPNPRNQCWPGGPPFDFSEGPTPMDADQFNSIHEKLVDRWTKIGGGQFLHLACMPQSVEDSGNLGYVEDCARQAGLSTRCLDVASIGLQNDKFVDLDGREIRLLFKLYPWEFMFSDPFGRSSAMKRTRFVEPPWKCLLSNKGALALLWDMEPGHPNLLPTYFAEDRRTSSLGKRFAEKPIWSREGANVLLMGGDEELGRTGGSYGAEGFVRQGLADMQSFDGNYPVLGSWLVGNHSAGMGIREDRSRITSNRSRFVPHAII